jgi:hypothetical protein
VPHKVAVVPMLDRLTDVARLWSRQLHQAEGEALVDNTDGRGFLSSLRRRRSAGKSAVELVLAVPRGQSLPSSRWQARRGSPSSTAHSREPRRSRRRSAKPAKRLS